MTQQEINSKREKRFRSRPVYISAKEVMKLTIWDNAEAMRGARNRGNLKLLIIDNKQLYDLNHIDERFLKPKA